MNTDPSQGAVPAGTPSQSSLSSAAFKGSTVPVDAIPETFLRFLREKGQEHLIPHLERLSHRRLIALESALLQFPWEEMNKDYSIPSLDRVTPCDIVRLDERSKFRQARKLGEQAYQKGSVGVLMVAGGQGTRLGSPAPKGCFPLMPVSRKSIFQVHAEKVAALSKRFNYPVPFLIMTSRATDQPTQVFFQTHDWFGLDRKQVHFFVQGMIPTTDKEGKILVAPNGNILENPDGHGGCLRALQRSKLLSKLLDGGIKELIYVQVDNVLCPFFDPFAVGLRHLNECDLVTKVMQKVTPDEKMGSLIRVDGKDEVVEYIHLTPELKRATAPDGSLLFGWGSPMMLVIGTGFLQSLTDRQFHLPYHPSTKMVKALRDGQSVEIEAYKREKFLFDVLPAAKNIGLEIQREREFAPVKGLTGIDSVESARPIISQEYARWLREAGMKVALSPGQFVEIDPGFAQTEEEIVAKASQLPQVEAIDSSFYLSDLGR